MSHPTLPQLAGLPLLAGIPGGAELWIVLLIILILFGSRLPGIARSLGQGISQFKKGLSDATTDESASKPSGSKPKDDVEP